MSKCMRILLVATMMAVGLAAGVTPAHAEIVGQAHTNTQFSGGRVPLFPGQRSCTVIFGIAGLRAHSAMNTGTSSTITLYRTSDLEGKCLDPVAVLDPGESDSGLLLLSGGLNLLGQMGADYYTST